jgi:hypothetical protein
MSVMENETEVVRWGFKSKTQLPLFMIWREYRYWGRVEFATVIFSTRDMRHGWFWRGLFRAQ